MLNKILSGTTAIASAAATFSIAALIVDYCVVRILDRHGVKILKLSGKKPAPAKKKPAEPKQA